MPNTLGWAAYGVSYPVRAQLRAIANSQGVPGWNPSYNLWIFKEKPDIEIDGIYWQLYPLPEGWKIITGGNEGVLGAITHVYNPFKPDRDDPANYSVLVHQWPDRCFDEDAEKWRYGVQHKLYRPLNDAEKEQLAADLAVKRARHAAMIALNNLSLNAERYDGKIEFAELQKGGEVYAFNKNDIIYGGGWWIILRPDAVWIVRNNGRDGDDWSYNNVITWGAGAVGFKLPVADTPKVRELLQQANCTPEPSIAGAQ